MASATLGWAWPGGADAVAAVEVEIGVALVVEHLVALAAQDGERVGRVGGQQGREGRGLQMGRHFLQLPGTTRCVSDSLQGPDLRVNDKDLRGWVLSWCLPRIFMGCKLLQIVAKLPHEHGCRHPPPPGPAGHRRPGRPAGTAQGRRLRLDHLHPLPAPEEAAGAQVRRPLPGGPGPAPRAAPVHHPQGPPLPGDHQDRPGLRQRAGPGPGRGPACRPWRAPSPGTTPSSPPPPTPPSWTAWRKRSWSGWNKGFSPWRPAPIGSILASP